MPRAESPPSPYDRRAMTDDLGQRPRSGRNFMVYTIAELANKLVRFVAAVILARELSISAYGLVNVGVAISGVTVMVTTVGLSELGARDVAVARERAAWFAGRLLTLRLIGVLTVGVLLGIAAIAGKPSLLPLVVVVSLMSVAMSSSSEWLLRGTERLGTLGIADLVGGLTVTTGCALMALTNATSVLGVTVFAAGEAVTTAICWFAVGRGFFPRVGVSGLRDLLRRSWPIGLSSLSFYAYYANIDTIILAATRSEREAGLYTAAYRLFLAANIVGIAAAYAHLPILARAVAAGDDRSAVVALKRTLYFLACYGAIVLGAAELGGHLILTTLFGARFGGMAGVLTVLCMGIAWYAVGFPTGYTLIARSKNRSFLAGSATAAVLNLSLNAVLIPIYGPIGAAIATFVAFVAACVVWMYAHDMLDTDGFRILALLTVITAAGLAALIGDSGRIPIAILTICAGVGLAAKRWREIPGVDLLRGLAPGSRTPR